MITPRDLGLDQERARRAVRALGPPEPDPSFRERLRQDFVSGAYARSARGRFLPLAAGLAAAAALIVVVAGILWMAPRAPRAWQVRVLRGTGTALVDERPIPLDRPEALARALHPGALLQVPADATVEVLASNALAFQVTSGSDLRLPSGRRGAWPPIVDAQVSRGVVLVATGPGFGGGRLEIRTPEGKVSAGGTTFSLICNDQGTCVCVLDGRVRVGPSAPERWLVVGPGWRQLLPRAPARAMVDRLGPEERAALAEFRARQGFPSTS